MHIKAKVDPIGPEMARIERSLAKAVTGGMADATGGLVEGLRAQVRGARLGDRLANTWRGRTYPDKSGTPSLHPNGYAWSKAPEIIGFYAHGGDIVPINGHKYLAVPTKAARALRMRRKSRLTVAEVEAKLGQKLTIIKGRSGNLLGLYDVNKTKAGNRRRGTKRELLLLFTFVPEVKGEKRFDVPALVKQVAAGLPGKIAARLEELT